MTSWEYAEIRKMSSVLWWTGPDGRRQLTDGRIIEHLNQAGSDGWELVSATESTSGLAARERVTTYTVKRPAATH